MQTILLTGNKGTIGTVISKNLEKYHFKPANLPEVDLTNHQQVTKALSNCEIVIHLAWHTKDDWEKEKIYSYNNLMTQNIYEAALQNKVKKVIMASSVHADDFYSWDMRKGYMDTTRTPYPTTLYGKSKVYEENLGKIYAQNGLEVICIRLGGVNRENTPSLHDDYESKVWLSHKDCISLIKKCIDTKTIPGRYNCFYAVSNNAGRLHDFSNPFGWKPQDNASNFMKE